MKACHAFVSLADLKNGKASGIVDAIHTSFHEIGASDDLLTKHIEIYYEMWVRNNMSRDHPELGQKKKNQNKELVMG